MAPSTLSQKVLLWGKRGFFAALAVVLLRILQKRKRYVPGKMGMTAMEESMRRAAAFGPTAKVTQINNILNSYCWFEDCPTTEAVAAHWTRVVEANKRFRAVPGNMEWILVETPISDHICEHAAPTEAAALEILNEISRTKEMPKDKPLWSVDIVRVAKGPSVILTRIHHVVGDGIGLVSQVLPMLMTNRQGQPLDLSLPQMPKRKSSLLGNILFCFDAVRSVFKVLGAAACPLETDLPMLDPNRSAVSYSGKRGIVFWPILSLGYIKKVKEASKCTVNDVMFSAWAGTVRKYCETHGHTFNKSATVRSLLSVAVPRSFPQGHDKEDMLTNYFTFVPVDFDTNTLDLKQRLQSNKSNLDIVKKTTIALVSLWIVNNLQPLLPEFLAQQTASDLFGRHSIVFSNVPGPKEDVNMYGKPTLQFQPVFLNLIPQLLAISCGQRLFMNVTMDPDVVKGIDELPRMFIEEMDAIGRAHGIEGTCIYQAEC